nr:amino acid ABC transporter permease [Deinococcus maricopensis]
MIDALPVLLTGARITVLYAVGAMLLGLPLAFLVALGRSAPWPPVRWLLDLYVSFIRGTPLLVQIFVLYYGLPGLGVTLDPVTSGVAALSLNVAAYMSVTIRASLDAVGRGQREAARSLGLSSSQTMRFVVLPQALRIGLPSLMNSLIGLIKDTSLVSVITVTELLRSAQLVIARTFEPFGPYLAAALIYWLISSLLGLVQSRLERRLHRPGPA